MKIRTLLIFIPAVLFPMAAYSQTAASENVDAPEIDACRASGLIALKERSPTIKDVELDLDSVRVIKMNSKIGDVDIKAMVLGEASIEKKTSSKAKNLICILGEKGKVLRPIGGKRLPRSQVWSRRSWPFRLDPMDSIGDPRKPGNV